MDSERLNNNYLVFTFVEPGPAALAAKFDLLHLTEGWEDLLQMF